MTASSNWTTMSLLGRLLGRAREDAHAAALAEVTAPRPDQRKGMTLSHAWYDEVPTTSTGCSA